MKILVVSDTHRRHENLDTAIMREMPDRIFHLGDGEGCEFYMEAIAECPVDIVCGNCDLGSSLPSQILVEVGTHRIMLTHGHCYGVNYGTETLIEAAKGYKADVVIYGHTHVPYLEQSDITVLNPGSISFPRQEGRRPSYAVMELDDDGELQYRICYL